MKQDTIADKSAIELSEVGKGLNHKMLKISPKVFAVATTMCYK